LTAAPAAVEGRPVHVELKGINLLNVQPVYQQAFKGSILRGAVALDASARRTPR
jgi:ribose/xylose/arabinose/galactoside ABC-type transport system permease subunit